MANRPPWLFWGDGGWLEGSSGASTVATARVAHPVPKDGPPCPHPAVPPCRDPPSRSPAAHRSTPRRSPMHEGPFTPLSPLCHSRDPSILPLPRGVVPGEGAPPSTQRQHPDTRQATATAAPRPARCRILGLKRPQMKDGGHVWGRHEARSPPHSHSHPTVHLPQSRRSPRERRPEPVGAHGAILPQPAGLTSGTSISMEITGSDSFPLTGAVGLQETCEK